MNFSIFSNTITLIAFFVLLLLYALEFVLRIVLKNKFSLFILIIGMNALCIMLFFIYQISMEETILFLLCSATISLLLGKRRGK